MNRGWGSWGHLKSSVLNILRRRERGESSKDNWRRIERSSQRKGCICILNHIMERISASKSRSWRSKSQPLLNYRSALNEWQEASGQGRLRLRLQFHSGVWRQTGHFLIFCPDGNSDPEIVGQGVSYYAALRISALGIRSDSEII